ETALKAQITPESKASRGLQAQRARSYVSISNCGTTPLSGVSRMLKNKHQAVSQGVRRFGKRSIFSDM
ncbi:MAG: hypothetical protein MZV70_49630, partial [Desulfobacterales bacterium]|nr:hypothetical protein [Desulfobacterales bacterium]